MSDTSNLLTGVCPGSHKEIGVQYKGQQVACQTCNQSVSVDAKGTVLSHRTGLSLPEWQAHWRATATPPKSFPRFRYLASSGNPGELKARGLQYRGSGSDSHCYFEFAVSAWGADRAAACMALSLCELKRLHEFLGSVISDVEQRCASSPRFYAQVKRADDYIKHPVGSPDIQY